ncbi:MAG TPA: hypothetical protein VFG69_12505, partial [Nannocystaceae bacterium]|nr:hypothetical protein [Nannocystaceae bacterium]
MSMRPQAIVSFVLVAAGCFNPDSNGDGGHTDSVGTIGSATTSGAQSTGDETVSGGPTPTTVDDSSAGDSVGESSTGGCTFQGCFCITDGACDDG